MRAENIRLKERVRRFLSDQQVTFKDDDEPSVTENGLKQPPKIPSKPAGLRQKKFMSGEPTDNLYFGTPGLASVITDVSWSLTSDSTFILIAYSLLASTSALKELH